MKTSIKSAIEIARRNTERAANTKDYLCRRKRDRKFRELARELTSGKGYILATEVELQERYPELVYWKPLDAKTKVIWAITYNNVWKDMGFCPIR